MGAVKNKMLEELDQVSEALYEAGQYQLTNEVVLSAMLIHKANNSFTIKQSLEFALKEWDL